MEKIDKIGFETKQDLKKLNNMIIEDVIRTFIFQILFLKDISKKQEQDKRTNRRNRIYRTNDI